MLASRFLNRGHVGAVGSSSSTWAPHPHLAPARPTVLRRYQPDTAVTRAPPVAQPELDICTARVEPFVVKLNRGTAYWMASLANAAYIQHPDHAPDVPKILACLKKEDPGIIDVVPFNRDGASALLVEHDHYFALAFRGTDPSTPCDWLDDGNIRLEQTQFGRFHAGFYSATMRIWPEMLKELEGRQESLRKANCKPKGVFLTGHSLGGAMSMVAACHLIHMGKPFTGVYTFGQPRAMDPKTADLFNARTGNRAFRFQNNNDIVPRVPPRAMGFRHTHMCVYIEKDKQIIIDPGRWLAYLDSLTGAAEAIKGHDLKFCHDHEMKRYLEDRKSVV